VAYDKDEYRTFTFVEITIRFHSGRKEKNRGDEPIWFIIYIYTQKCKKIRKTVGYC
jgi:hypothetical protein